MEGKRKVILEIHVARTSRWQNFILLTRSPTRRGSGSAAGCLRCHMLSLLTRNANEPFVSSKKRPSETTGYNFYCKIPSPIAVVF